MRLYRYYSDPMTIRNNSPQATQMADESMVRCLQAQAQVIWPQERPLFQAYALGHQPRILDMGCGTGEITYRLASLWPGARIDGVDLIRSHLDLAAQSAQERGVNATFHCDDAYIVDLAAEGFDLVVCRHLLQAIPDQKALLARFHACLRPGGVVHVLAEDYGLMQFHPTATDMDDFWRDGPWKFAESISTDLRSGRKVGTWLSELGFRDIAVTYLTIDSLRVDRSTLKQVYQAWADGFSQSIVDHTDLSADQVAAAWADIQNSLDDPNGYAVWHVPVWSARK